MRTSTPTEVAANSWSRMANIARPSRLFKLAFNPKYTNTTKGSNKAYQRTGVLSSQSPRRGVA